MRIKAFLLAGSAVAGLLLSAVPASAGAFYIQEQSVKGLGRAYSGEGADVGVDSLWWNPASIAAIDGRGQGYTGLHTVLVESEVRDTGSTITRPGQAAAAVGGYRGANPVLLGLVPNLGGAYRLNDKVVLGLAVTAPFNFTSKYTDQSFVRYQAVKSRLTTIDVQPTVAVHLTRWLDVGVGFDAEYTSSTLSNDLPNVSPLLPDGRQTLTGDGWDYGYTVGAQLAPASDWRFGLSYRSAIDHTLTGSVDVNTLAGTPFAQNTSAPGVARFTTPWMATLSGRWQATPKLALNGQVQQVGWSEFKSIDVTTGGAVQVTPQNYKDVTTAAVGADYQLLKTLTLRGGVQYDPTPTPDVGRTARVPDGDRWLFGTGATIKPRPNLSIDVAAAYIHFSKSQLNSSATAYAGTPLITPIDVSGQVSGQGAVLSTGVRYTF